ncbi:MAG: hypothetical protein H8E98_07980 [Bacteroidetes bacterium]|nr:hypothetical protein [Bacteroidota bacterium]
MKLDKFNKLIQNVEHSHWFKKGLFYGIITKNYYPYSNNDLYSKSNNIGQFTNNGFVFSCKEFAVEYNVAKIDHKKVNRENISELLYSKRLLLNHISDRNRITWRLLNLLASRQQSFIQSCNSFKLVLQPYKTILKDLKMIYPNEYMDSSIISRIVKEKNVILMNGEMIQLNQLFPKASYCIGLRIRKVVFEHKNMWSDTDIQKALSEKYDINISTRYVAYCRNAMGIPSVRNRGKCTPNLGFALGDISRWIRGIFIPFQMKPGFTN